MIWANTNAELPAPWRKHQSNGADTIRNGMQVWQREDIEDVGEMLNEIARLHGFEISEEVTRQADARLEAHRKARVEAERMFGVIGEAGSLTWLRTLGTEILVACYADPCEGKLYDVVPIPTRFLPAPNDHQGVPNIEAIKRGWFNERHEWVSR